MKRREEFEPIDDTKCRKDKVVITLLSTSVLLTAIGLVLYYLYQSEVSGDSAESTIFSGITRTLVDIIRFFIE